MEEMEFNCPSCKYRGDFIEEVCSNAVVAYNVSVNKDGEYVRTHFSEIFDYCVDRYQCPVCGFRIKDKDNEFIDNSQDLAEWLKSQGTQGEGRDAQHAAGAK